MALLLFAFAIDIRLPPHITCYASALMLPVVTLPHYYADSCQPQDTTLPTLPHAARWQRFSLSPPALSSYATQGHYAIYAEGIRHADTPLPHAIDITPLNTLHIAADAAYTLLLPYCIADYASFGHCRHTYIDIAPYALIPHTPEGTYWPIRHAALAAITSAIRRCRR